MDLSENHNIDLKLNLG